MRTYSNILRLVALVAVICFSYLVVMSDHGEEREPWEFVPVETR